MITKHITDRNIYILDSDSISIGLKVIRLVNYIIVDEIKESQNQPKNTDL